MSTHDKFLAKLKQKPTRTDIGFDETYHFLTSEKVGFVAECRGSSHYVFRHEGINPITIPRQTLKAYNIRQIVAALESLGIL